MKRYCITNKRTGKQKLVGKAVDVAVRVLAFGNNPDKYFIHKLLDNGEWVGVVLEGRGVYQIERELEEVE